MSQNYQNFPKFCDLSVKIAPDLKENLVFVAKNFKNWASFGFIKNGGLNSLTYVSPLEWEAPPLATESKKLIPIIWDKP